MTDALPIELTLCMKLLSTDFSFRNSKGIGGRLVWARSRGVGHQPIFQRMGGVRANPLTRGNRARPTSTLLMGSLRNWQVLVRKACCPFGEGSSFKSSTRSDIRWQAWSWWSNPRTAEDHAKMNTLMSPLAYISETFTTHNMELHHKDFLCFSLSFIALPLWCLGREKQLALLYFVKRKQVIFSWKWTF